MHRWGAAHAPATVIYLERGDWRSWRPVTSRLHSRLGGGIAQITVHRHDPGTGCNRAREHALPTASSPTDLDTAATYATGAIVCVATGTRCTLAQRWAAARCRENPAAVAGLVLLNPAATAPPAGAPQDPPSATDLGELREIPTWVVCDSLVDGGYGARFAEALWADHIDIPGGGHAVEGSHPDRVMHTVLTALEVAYLTDRRGDRP
ncbi:hypothetical protein IU469_29980 [Nocardia puris]|uniref:alpha/beta fold hydrolase n=1 Tax=Nocardia puris TaxID=208602 RepID=UPI0011BD9D7F|nr:hypothetical protein [Nocardia puris]MBF6369909.1 hypothetical protein [Nocardia puris]